MNGIEFYEKLRNTYIQNGQPLYGNFTFWDWLFKKDDNTDSFRFNIPKNNRKSIRKKIIIAAWEANIKVTDEWLIDNFNLSFHNDCRLHVLNYLINQDK